MVAIASKKNLATSSAATIKRTPVKTTTAITHKAEAAVKPASRGKTMQVAVKKTAVAAMPEEKQKKPKLVRDSFTMPEGEYAVLSVVKKNCLKAGIEVKKSQLLRIGLALLNKTDNATLKKMIAELPALKAGRPKKEK